MVHADRADTDDREVWMTGYTPSCYYQSVEYARPYIEWRIQVAAISGQVLAQ
jgi:hypothetical protein